MTTSGTPWARAIAASHVVWGTLGLALLWVAAPMAPLAGVARAGYWLLASEPGVCSLCVAAWRLSAATHRSRDASAGAGIA